LAGKKRVNGSFGDGGGKIRSKSARGESFHGLHRTYKIFSGGKGGGEGDAAKKKTGVRQARHPKEFDEIVGKGTISSVGGWVGEMPSSVEHISPTQRGGKQKFRGNSV